MYKYNLRKCSSYITSNSTSFTTEYLLGGLFSSLNTDYTEYSVLHIAGGSGVTLLQPNESVRVQLIVIQLDILARYASTEILYVDGAPAGTDGAPGVMLNSYGLMGVGGNEASYWHINNGYEIKRSIM